MAITTRALTVLETDRLTLRRPAASDAEAIFERYASDPDVTRFVGWPRHRSLSDTKAFLWFSEQEWEQWPAGPYLITTRADGRVIGGTGLAFQAPPSHARATRHAEAMTGYVLAKDEWGKGYEAYRDSRRPHFLGGWGLWDVQVGFRRRCVSARSGW